MRKSFGLKTFLIACVVLSAVFGIGHHLLTRQPWVLQGFLVFVGSAGAIGVLLCASLRSAIKHRQVWDSPRCRECGAENPLALPSESVFCRKCGAEITKLSQLDFEVVSTRDWRLLRWIGFALALPLLCVLAAMISFPGGNSYARMSTTRLIEDHLSADRPTEWRELERRLSEGRLSTQEVDAILKVAGSQAGTQLARGSAIHLPWARDFFKDPRVVSTASDGALSQLAAAVFHPTASLEAHHPGSSRSYQDWAVEVTSDGTGPFMDFGIAIGCELARVTIDGVEVQPIPNPNCPQTFASKHLVRVPLAEPGSLVAIELEIVSYPGAGKLNGWDLIPVTKIDDHDRILKRWKLKAEAVVEQ